MPVGGPAARARPEPPGPSGRQATAHPLGTSGREGKARLVYKKANVNPLSKRTLSSPRGDWLVLFFRLAEVDLPPESSGCAGTLCRPLRLLLLHKGHLPSWLWLTGHHGMLDPPASVMHDGRCSDSMSRSGGVLLLLRHLADLCVAASELPEHGLLETISLQHRVRLGISVKTAE